jgi:mono/diheme cytochrome c family protein
LGAGLALAGCAQMPQQVARQDFAAYCAACHGADGRGDGPAAAGLELTPPDLTRLAANNGGVFPRLAVMAQIDGYGRGGDMPEFGEVMLDGPTVLVDFGDGIATPTPERLVALTDYIASLQR